MKNILLFCLTALTVAVHAQGADQATVPEPSTLIFGKVIHSAFGHEHQLTEGTLAWTLRDSTGRNFTYTTELEDIQGVYSYRTSLPHQALASGLSVDSSVIPLQANEIRYEFVSISLNGAPVEVMTGGQKFLDMVQSSRASTYRIDLRTGEPLLDTDGDGMPDWWEKKYGLDWQIPDSQVDRSGDGWTNLQAYLHGADPNRDNRVPTLLTKEIQTYASSDNGIWLRVIDTDTTPNNLVFTLGNLPEGGKMFLISNNGSRSPLSSGSTFHLGQLLEGKVILIQENPAIENSSLTVSLTDGNSPSQSFTVGVNIFSPDHSPSATTPAPAWWRQENTVFTAYWSMRENVLNGNFIESSLLYFLGSNHGWTLWDQRDQTLPVSLLTSGNSKNFILGGQMNDTLTGGALEDILHGGKGTNRLRGNAGSDLFIVNKSGSEIIEDFNMLQDVLDLGSLLRGKTGNLNTYLAVQPITGGTEIKMNFSGSGMNYSDASIRLEGVSIVQDDLHRLWSNGQLLLGNVTGFSSVSIEGLPTVPLEEGFSISTLTFRRRGPVSQPLTVALQISGSATNGVDCTMIPTNVTFAAGSATAEVSIEPLTDGQTEGAEILQLQIVSGTGYVSSAIANGQLQFVDALQRFNIAADDKIAIANGQPGYFVITRSAANSSQIQIRLDVSGAIAGTDFTSFSTLVTFGSYETHRYVEIFARSLGELAGTEKSKLLTVSVRPSSTNLYLLGNSPSAGMRLLSEEQTLDSWSSQQIASNNSAGPASLSSIPVSPRTGLQVLLEYAFSYGVNLNDGVSAQERDLVNPRLTRDATGLYFEFNKRLNDPRLEYIVERSSDLKTWHSDPSLFSHVTLPTNDQNRGRVRYRVPQLPNQDMPYVRVRVTERP